MGVAEEVPTTLSDDDRPWVCFFGPLVAGFAPVLQLDSAARRHSDGESAGDGGVRMGGTAVGCRGRVLAQRRCLAADVLRERSDHLVETRADELIGVGGRRMALQHRHDESQRLVLGEDDRRQARPAADLIAAVAAP